MNARITASQKITEAPVLTAVQTGLLQRTCACGGASTPSGECAECRQKRLTGQSALIQPKLTVNQPGDRYEQEADRVAATVMRMSAPTIQRAPT